MARSVRCGWTGRGCTVRKGDTRFTITSLRCSRTGAAPAATARRSGAAGHRAAPVGASDGAAGMPVRAARRPRRGGGPALRARRRRAGRRAEVSGGARRGPRPGRRRGAGGVGRLRRSEPHRCGVRLHGSGRPSKRNPRRLMPRGFLRGAEGDRTPDLMTASHALSQLSYGPGFGSGGLASRWGADSGTRIRVWREENQSCPCPA